MKPSESRSPLYRFSNIRCLWLALFMLSPAAFAQTKISVRVIDAESGKPLKGVWISLSGSNTGKFQPAQNVAWRSKSKKTDSKGRAIFQLPDAIPAFLYVDMGPIETHGCSNPVFSTDEVLSTGALGSYRYDPQRPRWCPNLKAQAAPNPKEIVLFDKRFTKLDYLRQEIP